MLVLSRKKNESIVVDDDITIIVVDIRKDKVSLGVEAPKEVPVYRREVFEAIERERHDNGDLTSIIGESISNNQAYERFKSSLNSEDYIGAYDILSSNRNLSIPDEDNYLLIRGLGEELKTHINK